MLRLLGIATLILMAVCLAVGASIALANASSAPAEQPRPPVTHRTDRIKASTPNSQRPPRVKSAAA